MSDGFLFIAKIEQVFWARPLSTGSLVAIFVAIVVLSLYLYRRPWGLPLWLRVSLAVSRVLVLALVVATLLEPTAVVTESHTRVRSPAGAARCFGKHVDEGSTQALRGPRRRRRGAGHGFAGGGGRGRPRCDGARCEAAAADRLVVASGSRRGRLTRIGAVRSSNRSASRSTSATTPSARPRA